MKRSRFTEEQIIAILREHEAGVKTADKRLLVDRRAMTNNAIAGRPPGSAAITRIVIVANFRTSLAVGIVRIVCASGTAAAERVQCSRHSAPAGR